MPIEDKLDLLKQIKKVDAPPFLLTRIRQQIGMSGYSEAPAKWKWAITCSFLLILALNMTILVKTNQLQKNTVKNTDIEKMIKVMNLTNPNDFYNE